MNNIRTVILLGATLSSVAPLQAQFEVFRPPVGTKVATYALHPENGLAFGLAYDDRPSPDLLYVTDANDSKLYVYEVRAGGLTCVRQISTTALRSAFRRPRGLALGRSNGHSYLYAITCNTPGPGSYTFDSRLWRIDLDRITPSGTDWVDLNKVAVGYATKNGKLHDLTYWGGRVYISFSTSGFTETEALEKGILKIRVSEYAAPYNWWTRLGRGDVTAVEAILPNSGRSVQYGLAHMELGRKQYLWGTSGNDYIYLADGMTGRGIFPFESPGTVTRGLVFGNGYLWAVDSVSGVDKVHKINVASNYDLPVQGTRNVRHISMGLRSKAQSAVDDIYVNHNFAEVHGIGSRPNQNFDWASQHIATDRCDPTGVRRLYYDPARDSSSRQYYRQVMFRGGRASVGDRLTSTYDVDVWTSNFRYRVYPHRCTRTTPPRGDYTTVAAGSHDDTKIYKMSDVDAYEQFWEKLEDDLRREYGPTALSVNPYWRARNIVEFIVENYRYGNKPAGYHTANVKMKALFNNDEDDDKLSCSSSAFVMIGLCRYLGLPARWVGTTRQVHLPGKGVNWDPDGDGLLTRGETLLDNLFHRWVEVWLGDEYGWQRFDPTPDKTARPFSQWELMGRTAKGVTSKDLVLMIGSGYHGAFWDQKESQQRYNTCPRYATGQKTKWDNEVYRAIVWSNACFLRVTAPRAGLVFRSEPLTVRWTCSGRWDLDPTSKVSVYAQRVVADEFTGRTFPMGRRIRLTTAPLPYDAGETVIRLPGLSTGNYQIYVIKDGDSRTGGHSDTFRIVP